MLLIANIITALLVQFEGWSVIADVTFKWEYNDEVGAQIQMPRFGKKLLEMEGEEVTFRGYYLPFELDKNQIVISQLPYASCFFCGGDTGPESVLEVHFVNKAPRLKADQIVKVKGKLHLNPDDFDHLVFMLLDAELVIE